MQIHEGSLTTDPIAKIEVHDPDEIERLEAEIVYGKEIFVLVPASLNCSKVLIATKHIYFFWKIRYELILVIVVNILINKLLVVYIPLRVVRITLKH
jgi:hypothetical protein